MSLTSFIYLFVSPDSNSLSLSCIHASTQTHWLSASPGNVSYVKCFTWCFASPPIKCWDAGQIHIMCHLRKAEKWAKKEQTVETERPDNLPLFGMNAKRLKQSFLLTCSGKCGRLIKSGDVDISPCLSQGYIFKRISRLGYQGGPSLPSLVSLWRNN